MKRIGRLEVVAFVTGFVLLAYELVAARLLAPSIGSSTYVWTSVIGIIIAALSFGYWQGGKLADARNHTSDVAWMMLLTAFAIIVTRILEQPVLDWSVESFEDARWQAIVATTLLFTPASFLLGAISPYLAKLNVRSLERAGQSVASLGALNSIGGIAGTFVTGFWLFGYIGADTTLVWLVIAMVAFSWLMAPRVHMPVRAAVSAVLLLVLFVPQSSTADAITIDTPSARYVVEQEVTIDGRQVRGLATGPGGLQSGIYVDKLGDDELPFWYAREMIRLTIDQQPETVLMLGGGAFTIPQELARELPDAQIDVVEIDPELEAISKQYFEYESPENVELIFADARAYVEQTDKQYDVVLVDVYGDAEIPFTLMTAEFGQSLGEMVAPDGVAIVNLIAGLAPGPCRPVFAAFDQVYRQELPYAQYSTQRNLKLVRGNHVLLYSRQPQDATTGLQPLAALNSGPLYSDDFSPSERLYFRCQQA